MRQPASYTIDQLQVGFSAQISQTVSAGDIERFAELVGDFHPLHTDREYAQLSGCEDIIAHGLLISSFASRLIGMELPGKNALMVSQSFDYRRVVSPGETLFFNGIIREIDTRFDRIIVKVRVKRHDGLNVAVGQFGVIVRSKKINGKVF